MLPTRTVRDEVRWVEKCAHGKDLYEPCHECDELTKLGQEMMRELTPEEAAERARSH